MGSSAVFVLDFAIFYRDRLRPRRFIFFSLGRFEAKWLYLQRNENKKKDE